MVWNLYCLSTGTSPSERSRQGKTRPGVRSAPISSLGLRLNSGSFILVLLSNSRRGLSENRGPIRTFTPLSRGVGLNPYNREHLCGRSHCLPIDGDTGSLALILFHRGTETLNESTRREWGWYRELFGSMRIYIYGGIHIKDTGGKRERTPQYLSFIYGLNVF